MLNILLGSLLTEALVELLRKAKPLDFLRNMFKEENPLKCGWCTSFWVGILIGLFLPISLTELKLLNIIFSGIIYHRFSNLLHILFDTAIQIKFNKQYFNKQDINRT